MLDVHPPHHPTHTWRDFFIHIATIVVGLVIAVGLEQAVSAIHRHHERTELRASLRRELEQLAYDSSNVNVDAEVHTVWLKEIEDQIDSSIQTGQPLGKLPPPPPGKADDREDPFYRAAKASGRLTLLDEDEIAAYGEIDALVERNAADSEKLRSDYAEMVIAERELQHHVQHASGNNATAADLPLLQDRAVRLQMAVVAGRHDAQHLHNAAEAMLHGELDVKHIEAAER